MAIRPVLRMGHPLLRRQARSLTDAAIREIVAGDLLDDMTDTLHHEGGIGLAAPQIGIDLRLAIIEINDPITRYGNIETLPLTAFFNPCIRILDPTAAGYWEGCLSVPGLRGYVERPQSIRVDYQDRQAQWQSRTFEGFLATVFQHEFDHLDGVLYLDRIRNTRLLAFDEEYQQYILPRQAQP